MYRRDRRYTRKRRRRDDEYRSRWRFTSAFRTPAAQIAFLLFVALVIYLILQSAGR
jgi:hypothetical protein